VEYIIKAAKQGDVEAQYLLGVACQEMDGAAQDMSKTVEWWKKAAEQGHILAQYKLGNVYQEGVGIAQDMSKAVEWWQKAAEQGHVEAQYLLGQACHAGDGVAQDKSKAVKWWQKAAAQGHVTARCRILFGNASEDTINIMWGRSLDMRCDKAIAAFEQAIVEVFSKKPGGHKKALEAYFRARCFKNFIHWCGKGNDLYKHGNYKEALTAYERAKSFGTIGSSYPWLETFILHKFCHHAEALLRRANK
jgi:TPR repeat protein